jgi:hypothetical protein
VWRFLRFCPADNPLQFRGVQRSLGPEGPKERPTADRQLKAGRHGVKIRTPARQRTALIRNAFIPDQRHTQQIALGRALPTAHTGAFGAGSEVRPARHF